MVNSKIKNILSKLSRVEFIKFYIAASLDSILSTHQSLQIELISFYHKNKKWGANKASSIDVSKIEELQLEISDHPDSFQHPENYFWLTINNERYVFNSSQNISALTCNIMFMSELENDEINGYIIKTSKILEAIGIKNMEYNVVVDWLNDDENFNNFITEDATDLLKDEMFELDDKYFFPPTPYFFAGIYERLSWSTMKDIFIEQYKKIIPKQYHSMINMVPSISVKMDGEIILSPHVGEVQSSCIPISEAYYFIKLYGEELFEKIVYQIKSRPMLSQSLFAIKEIFAGRENFYHKKEYMPITSHPWEFTIDAFEKYFETINEVNCIDQSVNSIRFSGESVVSDRGVVYFVLNNFILEQKISSPTILDNDNAYDTIVSTPQFLLDLVKHAKINDEKIIASILHDDEKIYILDKEIQYNPKETYITRTIQAFSESYFKDWEHIVETFKPMNQAKEVTMPPTIDIENSHKDKTIATHFINEFKNIYDRTSSEYASVKDAKQLYDQIDKDLVDMSYEFINIDPAYLLRFIDRYSYLMGMINEFALQQIEHFANSDSYDKETQDKALERYNNDRLTSRIISLSLNKIKLLSISANRPKSVTFPSMQDIALLTMKYAMNISIRQVLLVGYTLSSALGKEFIIEESKGHYHYFLTNLKEISIWSSVPEQENVDEIITAGVNAINKLKSDWKNNQEMFYEKPINGSNKSVIRKCIETNQFALPFPFSTDMYHEAIFDFSLSIFVQEIRNTMPLSSTVFSSDAIQKYISSCSSQFEQSVYQAALKIYDAKFIRLNDDYDHEREFDVIIETDNEVIMLECISFMSARFTSDLRNRVTRIQKKQKKLKDQIKLLEKKHPDKNVHAIIVSQRKTEIAFPDVIHYEEVVKWIESKTKD